MKAVIAGGGIGGLAAGLALAQSGWEVTLLEQAIMISEVGAGVQISPNGLRALQALGVMEALEPELFEPESIQLRMGVSGRSIFTLPMKGVAEQRWGARFIQLHRADLQFALKKAFEVLPQTQLRTGAKVTGYVRERGGAAVYLEGGERIWGDLVVGADGLHSVIRAQMLGPDRTRFTGNVAWRMTVPTSELGDAAPPLSGCVWAGRGRHAVTTRIRAGEIVNFVGVVEQEEPGAESWSAKGARDEALTDFDGWVPEVTGIIEKAEKLNRWALYDRLPLASWTDGPVTLLGDAAHPMLPSMAQGAVMALEDAVVLSRSVSHGASLDAGLASYFGKRRDRTARVQKRSAANLRLFHKAGFGSLPFYGPVWLAAHLSPALIHKGQDWIYKYDPSAA